MSGVLEKGGNMTIAERFKRGTVYVQTRAGSVFVCIPGRKSLLYIRGKREPHDFPRDEIIGFVQYEDWKLITAAAARKMGVPSERRKAT